MGGKRADRRFRLAAIVGSLAVGFGAAEIGLRLVSEPPGEMDVLAKLAAGLEAPTPSEDCRAPAPQALLRHIVDPSAHPDLIYELRPNSDTCFEGARVTVSSRGVRSSSELASPKPEGTYRILALSDSHGFGWGISHADTVASQLQDALKPVSEDRVEVVNAGIPGYSAYQEAAWLEAYGADFEPDCVIVLFVANDMGLPHFLLQDRKPGPSRLWDAVKRATGSKRWFTFAPNELATFVTEVDMDRIPPEYRHMVGEEGYRDALRKMADWAQAARVDLVNVFDYSTLELDSDALVVLQEGLGITAFEVPWPMDPALRVSEADPHLNRRGNARVVELLVEGLRTEGVCLPPHGDSGTEADALLGGG
ncbi:MAG: SGNH/GDSL hydrolase family protein [Thermoanaerobaculia bacterium]